MVVRVAQQCKYVLNAMNCTLKIVYFVFIFYHNFLKTKSIYYLSPFILYKFLENVN